MDHYTDEKSPLTEVEVLPVPVTYVERKRPSFFGRLLRFVAVFFATLFLLNYTSHAATRYLARPGCQHKQGGGGQKPLPPHDKWHSYKGTTHFELEDATGLSVVGADAFGKVIFETSKLSDKIVIDLDISTRHKDAEIGVEEKDGYLTVTTDGDTHADARIRIPSGIIKTVGLPKFDVNVPHHMIDYSSLPESLEIGVFALRTAKGYVKTGTVHTNTTQITIADGAIKGKITQAREETSVDVAKGNVTLDVASHKKYGSSNIKLGNGHLKGSFPVYNSTTLDVATGSIYVNARFESQDGRGELNTKIASGTARVFVDSIAAERLIEGSHISVSGDQLITYPDNFQGTIDARGIAGEIKLEGHDMAVEKVFGGLQGKKGDSERNYVSVKAAKGKLDIFVGDDEE